MPKSSKRAVNIVIILMAILLVLGFLAGLINRPGSQKSYFGPAPKVVMLHNLGTATNYLKFDHNHAWKAFSVSNGTSKTLFYTTTEIEYRTTNGWISAGSWLSNTLTNTSLMTHRETAGEISPGTTDVFYATIAASNVPWRLRIGCFEKGLSDDVDRIAAKMRGLPPAITQTWSGRRFELISEEIAP